MTAKDFYDKKDGVSLFWLGNDGWVIDLYGTILATDLDLCLSERVPLPDGFDFDLLAENLAVMFITHGHGDHFNEETCRRLLKKSGCLFVVPVSCIAVADSVGIPPERRIAAEPGRPFSVLDLNVRPVRALHGHYRGSVYSGASMGDCGYVIEKNGFSLYQPGDTVLLEEHFDMKGLDLAFFSPTEHNMHIENSALYLSLLDPGACIPQHYDSYAVTDENAFWTKGFPDEVYAILPEELKKRFIKPEGQGRVITLTRR